MDRLQSIKYKRLKPEEKYLYDIMINLKPKKSDDYPESIFYTLDKTPLFEYIKRTDTLAVSYNGLWRIFKEQFGLSDEIIYDIITRITINILKLTNETEISLGVLIRNRSKLKDI
jgi:hypothetical protein